MNARALKLILLAFMTSLVTVGSMTLQAQAVNFPVAERNEMHGYFTNIYKVKQDPGPTGGNVIDGGINVSSKAELIQFFESRVNDANLQTRTGARFVIQTMRGPQGGGLGFDHDYNVSAADIADWKDKVNNPEVSVNWNESFNYDVNSMYLGKYGSPTPQDDAFYRNIGNGDSIVFRNAQGKVLYAIRKECVNPVGDILGLPGPWQPTVVACGTMTVSTSKAEIGQPLNVRTTVTYTGGPPPPMRTVTGGVITVSGPGGTQSWGIASPSDNGSTITMVSPNFTLSAVGSYTVTWNVQVNGVSPTGAPCPGAIPVQFEVRSFPYFEVRAGDTAAGARFATSPGGTCGNSNENAGITSWNTNASPFSGAGTQYGAFAWSFIQEYVTNKGNSATQNSLSFSNRNPVSGSPQSVDLANGLYGGFFEQGPCVSYWANKPANGQSLPSPGNVDVNALTSGVYVHNGNVTINGSTLAPGKRITLYVSGNVRIVNDVTYGGANPSWANVNQISLFKIVAQGSIFIDAGVNRLDGVYVAVPANNGYPTTPGTYVSPAAGTISTCSTGFAVRSPSAVGPYLSNCDEPLVVNGSLVANHMFLLRSYGTMSGGTPGELINFSPEVWLAPTQSVTIDPTYQSIVGLPPVL